MKERLIIFLILMGSYLGFYLAFPLFSTIFLNSNCDFLPRSYSMGTRSILLGLTYSTYYLGAFLGTPLIGKISDRYGKKPILSITFLLVGIMYLFSSFAIQLSSLSLLLILRFLTGFFDGCYSLAYSTLIGIEKRVPHIEFWTTMVINVGWILGSFIGWNLIAQNSLSISYPSTPLLGASLIYISCFLLILFYFKTDEKVSKGDINFDIGLFFSTLTSLKHSSLRPILISNTLFYAAIFIFSSYILLFLMKQYSFQAATLATVETFLCTSYCFAPFTYWLYLKYSSRKQIMCISAFGIAISLILLMTISFRGSLWIFLFMTSYFSALGFSFSPFLVTDNSPLENHGEALGVSQALFLLIEAIVSFLSGIFAAIWIFLPLIVAVICSLLSAIWIIFKLIPQTTIRSLKN